MAWQAGKQASKQASRGMQGADFKDLLNSIAQRPARLAACPPSRPACLSKHCKADQHHHTTPPSGRMCSNLLDALLTHTCTAY